MIDVFIRIAPRHPVRESLARAVAMRWVMELDVRMHAILGGATRQAVEIGDIIGDMEVLAIENFAWTSRRYAEERAAGELYILADDDHLILGKDWVKRAVTAAEQNPGYGILAARSVIQTERFGGNETEVIPHPYVGCPCVIRRGAVDYGKLQSPANLQDGTLCDAMRAAGYTTGFIRGLDYNHLGHGFSQVEPVLWMRY